MGINYQYSGGLIVSLLVLTVLVALPMKIGARMVSARHSGIIRCGFAAFVGVLGGFLAAALLGGLIGGALGFAIGYLLSIRAMLGTSILGAIALTLVAMLISVVGFWLLAKLGVIVGTPLVPTGVSGVST